MRRPKFEFVQELMGTIAERMRRSDVDANNSMLPAPDRISQACAKLMSKSGEASQVATATEALRAYSDLSTSEKEAFFHTLLESYGADPEAVRHSYAAWEKSPSQAALTTLFNAVEPKRQTLLRRLNLSSGGTSVLVEMRADLLDAIRIHPELSPVDADFSHLFASWFNRGFLVMRRIDWDTPASILDKIVEYEAVHQIRDWDDLRRRLEPSDRRCYAFFHPSTGDEPLIFVEVALSKGVSRNIAPLLSAASEDAPDEFDTAVFYSISNCQKGLKGVSFGNFLIKQVVQELHHELPDLKRFVTLSPMPGFAKWLDKNAINDPEVSEILDQLKARGWCQDGAQLEALTQRMEMLCADYLNQKSTRSGAPIDPVARFHLGNGACVFNVNWPADMSDNGVRNSYGAMVNYLYELDKIDERHEGFVETGEIAMGDDLRRRLKKLEGQSA